MKSKSLLVMALIAVLTTGLFSFASANSQTEQKSKALVTESKEFRKLNTTADGQVGSYILAWTKGASSAIIAWETTYAPS